LEKEKKIEIFFLLNFRLEGPAFLAYPVSQSRALPNGPTQSAEAARSFVLSPI
jgi:hypothetical protein